MSTEEIFRKKRRSSSILKIQPAQTSNGGFVEGGTEQTSVKIIRRVSWAERPHIKLFQSENGALLSTDNIDVDAVASTTDEQIVSMSICDMLSEHEDGEGSKTVSSCAMSICTQISSNIQPIQNERSDILMRTAVSNIPNDVDDADTVEDLAEFLSKNSAHGLAEDPFQNPMNKSTFEFPPLNLSLEDKSVNLNALFKSFNSHNKSNALSSFDPIENQAEPINMVLDDSDLISADKPCTSGQKLIDNSAAEFKLHDIVTEVPHGDCNEVFVEQEIYPQETNQSCLVKQKVPDANVPAKLESTLSGLVTEPAPVVSDLCEKFAIIGSQSKKADCLENTSSAKPPSIDVFQENAVPAENIVPDYPINQNAKIDNRTEFNEAVDLLPEQLGEFIGEKLPDPNPGPTKKQKTSKKKIKKLGGKSKACDNAEEELVLRRPKNGITERLNKENDQIREELEKSCLEIKALEDRLKAMVSEKFPKNVTKLPQIFKSMKNPVFADSRDWSKVFQCPNFVKVRRWLFVVQIDFSSESDNDSVFQISRIDYSLDDVTQRFGDKCSKNIAHPFFAQILGQKRFSAEYLTEKFQNETDFAKVLDHLAKLIDKARFIFNDLLELRIEYTGVSLVDNHLIVGFYKRSFVERFVDLKIDLWSYPESVNVSKVENLSLTDVIGCFEDVKKTNKGHLLPEFFESLLPTVKEIC